MKFGIFLHWGIYSTFAQGEWYLQNAKIDRLEYAKAADPYLNKESFVLVNEWNQYLYSETVVHESHDDDDDDSDDGSVSDSSSDGDCGGGGGDY